MSEPYGLREFDGPPGAVDAAAAEPADDAAAAQPADASAGEPSQLDGADAELIEPAEDAPLDEWRRYSRRWESRAKAANKEAARLKPLAEAVDAAETAPGLRDGIASLQSQAYEFALAAVVGDVFRDLDDVKSAIPFSPDLFDATGAIRSDDLKRKVEALSRAKPHWMRPGKPLPFTIRRPPLPNEAQGRSGDQVRVSRSEMWQGVIQQSTGRY